MNFKNIFRRDDGRVLINISPSNPFPNMILLIEFHRNLQADTVLLEVMRTIGPGDILKPSTRSDARPKAKYIQMVLAYTL